MGYIARSPSLIIAHAVHPHACGVHFKTPSPVVVSCGSSPRMWGTSGKYEAEFSYCRFIPTHVGYIHCSFCLNKLQTRFIPTHVGYINAFIDSLNKLAVHPHACGVHYHEHPNQINQYGSSPRMWGTCASTRYTAALRRFIPTHVGYILNYFATKSTKYTSLKIYQLY